MVTPSVIFTINGKWSVDYDFVRKIGLSRKINVAGPIFVDVVDPDGKSFLLYHSDKTPLEYWLDYESGWKLFPSNMSLKTENGQSASESNVFDKPGKYRLRATMQIQPLTFISLWRTIRSKWVTLWIVDSQEWMKPQASAPR